MVWVNARLVSRSGKVERMCIGICFCSKCSVILLTMWKGIFQVVSSHFNVHLILCYSEKKQKYCFRHAFNYYSEFIVCICFGWPWNLILALPFTSMTSGLALQPSLGHVHGNPFFSLVIQDGALKQTGHSLVLESWKAAIMNHEKRFMNHEKCNPRVL